MTMLSSEDDDFERSFEKDAGEVATAAADGSPFVPLDMQRKLARLLTEHQRVIAIQPTGAGKTKAAALPFVTNLLSPAQMVFMTPMRTLTSAQADALTTSFQAAVVARNLGLTGKMAHEWVQQQTGTTPNDPDFLAPATVATFDQALSSATRISYSSSRRRRTVNAGAILSSYLVADELHLFPRDEALATLLCLLKYRPPELPFLLMTATLTRPIAEALAKLLDATVFADSLSASDQDSLNIAGSRRIVRWQAEPLNADQIIRARNEHPDWRILVVANTVRRAIELAQAIERERGDLGGLCVLHSRFYQEHRSQHEEMVKLAFSKPNENGERSGEVRIAVATQVVEVGLDISADLIFTELAPANALVQRWGRSARWGGDAAIVVAPPSPDPTARIYPYSTDADKDIIGKTRDWLETHAQGDGILIGVAQEHDLLDVAHREADEKWVAELASLLSERANDIGKAIAEGNYSLAGKLIRHVNSRTVLIYGGNDKKFTENLKEPLKLEGFSLAPGTLMPLLPKKAQEENTNTALEDDEGEGFISLALPTDLPDTSWRLRYPKWSNDVEDSEAKPNEALAWVDVTNAKEIATQPLLAINPEFVAYDPFFGLLLARGKDGAVPQKYWALEVEKNAKQPPVYSGYTHETYEEHIRRMLELYQLHPKLGPHIKHIAALVDDWLGWPSGMLDRVISAAIVAHDAGKLSPAWQAGIASYQQAIHKPMQPWLVHTDTPPRGVPKPRWKQPHHALSGAAHSMAVGSDLDAEVIWAMQSQPCNAQQKFAYPSRVLFTAIATHHSPDIGSLELSAEEVLDQPAIDLLNQLLGNWKLPAKASILGSRDLTTKHKNVIVDQHQIATPTNRREIFALALVIRMLRLADGWSQDPAIRKEANVT